MHDPMTVAHEIRLGSRYKKNGNYRTPVLTIWHNDPEIGGSDDSCGYSFSKVDPKLVELIQREFEFEFKYWFDNEGNRKFSTMGVVLCMYSRAAWSYFIWKHKYPSDRAFAQYRKFMRKYLFDILHFAENPTDSLWGSINGEYGEAPTPSRFSYCVIRDIVTKQRKWYQHPKWHIHHWKLQFPFIQSLIRRYWTKCCICGKRGFGNQSPCSDWSGNKKWHCECSGQIAKTEKNETT